MTNVRRFVIFAAIASASVSALAGGITVQVNDSAGKPLADAVIVVEPADSAALPQLQKGSVIEQRGLKFLPTVSVVQTGSRVSFPNNDKVKHHIYSFSPAKKFDQKLYSGVAAAPQVFDKAGLVVLGCNIHDRMVAYVKVVDSPFFAKTDAGGVARIELPASGKYTVSAWHYNMSGSVADQPLVLKAEAAAPLVFKLNMKPVVDPAAASSGY